MPDDDVRCATCGRELEGDRADDPDDPYGGSTDEFGRPICEECLPERERELDAERDQEREDDFVLIDLFDGQLDGHLDDA